MSMTYYAVTDDPNELAHYGILGMKWGVVHDNPRHQGSRGKQRSAAYKKAQSKLGRMMKSGIRKAEAKWKAYNSPKAKYERQTNKALEQARKGKLKYGKLDDWQVQRITQRLDMERQARSLSNTEPKFLRRLGRSVSEGIITGFGKGTTSYIDARLRGRGETTAEIKKEERLEKFHGKAKNIKRKAKRELNEEYYKTAYEEGDAPIYKSATMRAKYLSKAKAREQQNKYRSEIDQAHDTQLAKSRALNDAANINTIILNAQAQGISPAAALKRYQKQQRLANSYGYTGRKGRYGGRS